MTDKAQLASIGLARSLVRLSRRVCSVGDDIHGKSRLHLTIYRT